MLQDSIKQLQEWTLVNGDLVAIEHNIEDARKGLFYRSDRVLESCLTRAEPKRKYLENHPLEELVQAVKDDLNTVENEIFSSGIEDIARPLKVITLFREALDWKFQSREEHISQYVALMDPDGYLLEYVDELERFLHDKTPQDL